MKATRRDLVIISGCTTTAVLLGSYLIAPMSGIIHIGYAWIAVQGRSAFTLFLPPDDTILEGGLRLAAVLRARKGRILER